MKTNEGERLVRKTHPPSCFECKGPSPPPCIRPSFRTGSSVGNATSNLRYYVTPFHSLAFDGLGNAPQSSPEQSAMAGGRRWPVLQGERWA